MYRIPSAVRLLPRRLKVDAFLVTDLSNIRYLTGCTVSSGIVIASKKCVEFFVDSRYSESVEETSYPYITIRSHLDFPSMLKTFRTVGFEAENVTVARLARWKKKNPRLRFKSTTGIIEDQRRAKSDTELRSIARACAITKKVLRLVPSRLRVGTTERSFALELETLSRSLGAESMAFETIVAFGENTSRPHHHPTERKLRRDDIVQIDMGVKVDGYCSDYSRVLWMSEKTPAQARAYKALLEAKKSAEKLVRSGVTNRSLDVSARQTLQLYGYDKEFCHSLGHGLGLDIHEMPSISTKAPIVRLKKNEVITIEPGLYFPGEWGMRVEDTIVVR